MHNKHWNRRIRQILLRFECYAAFNERLQNEVLKTDHMFEQLVKEKDEMKKFSATLFLFGRLGVQEVSKTFSRGFHSQK